MATFISDILDHVKNEMRSEIKQMVASASAAHEAIKSEARRKGLSAVDSLRLSARQLLGA